MPVSPKPAATVILARETAGRPVEFYLLKRSRKAAFMAETYVFPGGMVEAGDHSADLLPFLRDWNHAEEAASGEIHSPGRLRPFRVGAVRELFEESGVLLAYDRRGALISLLDGTARERIELYRRDLLSGSVTLQALCRGEQITLGLDRLFHYGHWITPEIHPLRFDTHFFLALCPDGQEPEPDHRETTDGIWLSPAEALGLNMSGSVILSPPAIIVMDDLGRHSSFQGMAASLELRRVEAVLPVFVRLPEEVFVVFPWDPEYAAFRAGTPPGPYDHGSLVRGEAPPTRVVFSEGIPLPYRRE